MGSVHLYCPECGVRLPFFVGASRYRIRRSFFSPVWFECPKCGCVSRGAISWPNALWSWPLAILVTVSIVYLFRTTDVLVALHRSHEGVYGALGGISVLPGMILFRFGLTFKPISGLDEAKSKYFLKSLLAVALVLAAIAIIGLVTGRWMGCAIGLGVGIAVSTVFYLTARRKPDGKIDEAADAS